MYTPEMLESIKKVEATRAERLGMFYSMCFNAR